MLELGLFGLGSSGFGTLPSDSKDIAQCSYIMHLTSAAAAHYVLIHECLTETMLQGAAVGTSFEHDCKENGYLHSGAADSPHEASYNDCWNPSKSQRLV